MSTINYRTVLKTLQFAGAVLLLVGSLVHERTVKGICYMLAAGVFFAALVQIVLFKWRPELFGPKDGN